VREFENRANRPYTFLLGFAALFGTFLLMGYLMLYALTHMRMAPVERAA
jgi:hypothetical protein